MVRDAELRAVHRQAATAVGRVLESRESKRNGASIKSLTLAPRNVRKKATHAITCETIRYIDVIKAVASASGILQRSKVPKPLLFVLVFDLLFGEGLTPCGQAEEFVLSHKAALRSSLSRLLLQRKVSDVKSLLPQQSTAPPHPRYMRVNTLKGTVSEMVLRMQQDPVLQEAQQDDIIPELFSLPPGTDLHDHQLVREGALILQGKSSCFPAFILDPEPGWKVLDACAAPGNKTTHLAALLRGTGSVIACDKDEQRLQLLRRTVEKAGAEKSVDAWHQDFLQLDPQSQEMSEVRAILLDPSCSGSGISRSRLDHFTSNDPGSTAPSAPDNERVEKLARFQELALKHAFKFPGVERIVYSTCSVHERENEQVVAAVLSFAESLGFSLCPALQEWPRRGLPNFLQPKQAYNMLRVDETADNAEGFFVVLFEREITAPKMLHFDRSAAAEHKHLDFEPENQIQSVHANGNC